MVNLKVKTQKCLCFVDLEGVRIFQRVYVNPLQRSRSNICNTIVEGLHHVQVDVCLCWCRWGGLSISTGINCHQLSDDIPTGFGNLQDLESKWAREHKKEKGNIAFDGIPKDLGKMEDLKFKSGRKKMEYGAYAGEVGQPADHVWESRRKGYNTTQYEMGNADFKAFRRRKGNGGRECDEGYGKRE